MSIRHEIAAFCAKMTFDALPDEIVQFTKVCLMDQLCLMVAGTQVYSEDYPGLAGFITNIGGREESTIVGLEGKIPCLNATLVDTAIGIITKFDAVHKTTIRHLPAALLPAMIAVAESRKSSGRDLILAIVVGAEVMVRFGISLGARPTYSRGFHPTSVCAPFGCATGAGKLLGLTESGLAEALSIAAVQASGSSVWAGSIQPATFSFQIGKAAQSGVMAAMLAETGFSGFDMIFEDERGFLDAYSENPDPTKLTDGLGTRYEIKELGFKRFCVGTFLMTSIEALLDVLNAHNITPDMIESIAVRLPTVVMPLVGTPEFPSNRSSVSVNTRYVLAVMTYMGNDAVYDLALSGSENRQDPRIFDLYKRISVIGDAELDKVFPEKKSCIVTIETKDGRQFSERNDGPFKGDPDNPLSERDVEAKFYKIATPQLGRERVERIATGIRELDKLDDLSKLIESLTF